LEPGFLLLGKSEALTTHADLFTPADSKARIYLKRSQGAHLPFEFGRTAFEEKAAERNTTPEASSAVHAQKEADRVIWNRYSHAGLILNDALEIVDFRGDTAPYLAPPHGKASLELLKMIREELRIELRTAAYKAKKDNLPVRREGIRLEQRGGAQTVNLEVLPLTGLGAKHKHYLVLFDTVPSPMHRCHRHAC
jgi:two-component system CheB/CheR fusion protein